MARLAAFLQALRQLGWTDGQNVRIHGADRVRERHREMQFSRGRFRHQNACQPTKMGDDRGGVADRQDQTEIKSCFEHSLSRPFSVSPPWYLRKAVLMLKAGGVPSTAMAARIADSTHTDSVVRTSEVLGALADGICRGDERTNSIGTSRSAERVRADRADRDCGSPNAGPTRRARRY
jgi:hypothetical protein